MDNSIKNFQNGVKYKSARYSLLLIIILSVVNLFSIVFTDMYFLFSSYVTQLIAYLAFGAYYYNEITLMVVYIALGIISVLPYVLCYIFSKKKIGWMIAAMIMFAIDTVLLVVDFISLILAGEGLVGILDIVFHIYALGSIIACVVYGVKLKKSEGEIETNTDLATDNPYTYSDDTAVETRRITVSKKKQSYGFALECICCVDGKNLGTLKNGEEKDFVIDCNAHNIVILTSVGISTEAISIPSGCENKSYEVTYKFNFFKGAVPQISEKL